MEHNNSPFEQALRQVPIPTCNIFLQNNIILPVQFKEIEPLITDSRVQEVFPTLKNTVLDAIPYTKPQSNNTTTTPAKKLRIAAFFSGGPAAGGHNVLVGLNTIITSQGHTLLGIHDGPGGLLAGKVFDTKSEDIAALANTGGFDYLGTDRTKINTFEQIDVVRKVCVQHQIDAIIVIGGDDSNTNAAFIAEHLTDIQVISVPKTMDGDVQFGNLLPVPFGYDTACRIYAEMVGNILQDTPSSRKYWHFVKLMGRTASQVVLEVALETQPHITLISEEVAVHKKTLNSLVEQISDTIIERSRNSMNYGVVLVPEGLLEFTPDVQELIDEIDDAFGKETQAIHKMHIKDRIEYFTDHLIHRELFVRLPQYIQEMLLANRDAHGNLQVSQIATERLLAEMVEAQVATKGGKCSTQTHSFGYEGRCGAPTAFDAMLGYNLGLCAASLVLNGRTGYMAAVTDFIHGGKILGLPLKGLLFQEHREGKDVYVIRKSLVKLDSAAYIYFNSQRSLWASKDTFCSPGPRQYWGPTAKQLPYTVIYNQGYNSSQFKI